MKKKTILKVAAVCFVFLLTAGALVPLRAFADENTDSANTEEQAVSGTSISLMPVSKVLQIASNSTYEDTLTVNNDGDEKMDVEVYAAPYSYVYSEVENIYKLGFNRENNFTQITRWITFEDADGEWKTKANYSIPAHESLNVKYKITTPDDIPAGGQYAVIFVHTLTAVTSANGIRTEASPGMIIYGRNNDGDVRVSADISDMTIKLGVEEDGSKRNNFYASAKVKNDGNIDFSAVGKLKVDSVLGGGSYETPGDRGRISVIPDSELVVSDEWENSPSFGIYKVTWTVTAGDATETIETVVFVNPLLFIIIMLIVLTIIIAWVTIVVRKRKERRSRLAV
ncbi:hypothetical protein IKE82_01895 [Candidatus Saccharibacteria bacterium]|nr:hypothetical protein [Candidatus Saccharibacteria bacterium]